MTLLFYDLCPALHPSLPSRLRIFHYGFTYTLPFGCWIQLPCSITQNGACMFLFTHTDLGCSYTICVLHKGGSLTCSIPIIFEITSCENQYLNSILSFRWEKKIQWKEWRLQMTNVTSSLCTVGIKRVWLNSVLLCLGEKKYIWVRHDPVHSFWWANLWYCFDSEPVSMRSWQVSLLACFRTILKKCWTEKHKKNVLEHFADFTAILISVMHTLLSMTCRETLVSP